MIDKLSERDICTKFITPAILKAGWDQNLFREEVNLTAGRVFVRGKLAARIKNPDAKGGPKRADYVLYAYPNIPIAVIEAKQSQYSVGHGMQQALLYAEMLDVPFAFSSNGEGFLFHDRTGITEVVEQELTLDNFPSLDQLIYVQAKRWQGTVGRPELQAFFGALAGQKAKKGIFITTSSYTTQAMDFAKSVDGMVLVDGNRLANLMIEYEIGVTSKSIRVPKIDGDYFEEESA